ncbi:putative inorganic carbon transporter subunit DabA, partial [Methylacidiphilum caldifontis]|uniref:putative inorganic carbon transporter subunit DabA n=1 Tax=Methylacidiphilum caldifontis TaxID=2795386 RepID=UPI00106C149E
HSYDYREDPSGRWLMNIVNGPLIVAHWINMEYYFSTVDNAVYGSGSKVTANVVGGLGVMQGSHSDLKPGLPWQSVRDTDGAPYHEPMRLLVVIEAPRERIQGVLDALPLFRQLVHNAWVHLLMYDPMTEELVRYQPEVATVASI